MPPESKKWLLDMLEAASLILTFVENRSFNDFVSDKLFRGGVYFQYVIIGEALSQLRAFDEVTAEKVSDYWRIIGFRNQIVHGYKKIDDEITWKIIKDNLPLLRDELTQLLKS